MQMHIAEMDDGLVGVWLTGRLDTPAVESIEIRLTDSLVPRGARAIIDLSQVEFVGSMALRLFITLTRELNKNHGRLVLYAPQPWVDVVFATASLSEAVTICGDSAAAAAAARA